ncbi:MAG: NAD-glutamate dehydrogenase [Phycisphaerales bacterium]|jgi:glutamate dehydrogenase|nr:NAD-glutamate dehydrogenase [Phycisphaerales bacterium]
MSAGTPTPASHHPKDAVNVVDLVVDSLRVTSEEVVPWFLEQMPGVYFQDTDEETRLVHLRAIIAARASGRPVELTLRSEDANEWTSMRPLDYPGVLAELVAELPKDQPLRAATIHTAHDGTLVIDTFEFGEVEPCDLNDPAQAARLEQTIAYAATEAPEWEPDAIRDFFTRCSSDVALTLTPLRMVQHWRLFKQVTGSEGTAVVLEPEADPSQSRISVAVANSTRRTMLERIAERLSNASINIHRAYLDTLDDGSNGSVSFVGFVVTNPDGGAIDPNSRLWQRVRHDLMRIKWVDQRAIDLSQRHADLDLTHGEAIVALSDLVHQTLVHRNRYAFTSERVRNLAVENLALTVAVVDLFLDRFQPDHPLGEDLFHDRAAALTDRIDADVDLEDARVVLHAMLTAVLATLRTNVYLEGRYALSMRLDPALLQSAERPDLPYGVFYVHGRGFNGFHVRFRDIARGGVRAVLPRSGPQFSREAERLFDEAYGLASAQQLKNKDIPEGGSKAAILVHPNELCGRSVKAFVDSMLDLIVDTDDVSSRVVDRLGQKELIYLGPDENISPSLIDWIVARAAQRGYPVPTALMSSKPGAGINHKEFGVTSEGVIVFLDVGLGTIGIDPRSQTFTVKMTGGPDGDVGGNAIRIMHREFGTNARIVGVADGSGSAEDPDGLDHEELLRLVDEGLPIASFDATKLGKGGRVSDLEEVEGVRFRNTLHNRVAADAFLPCGGRPATIHESNWREFLREDGTPSSRLIVEGANLFLTPDARAHLADAGAVIFKDSSANKCGVICSSYEIGASMLLTPEEFIAIKQQFVDEVLVKLREMARLEAELLARMLRRQPRLHLPDASVRLSRAVIRTADAIESSIERLGNGQLEVMATVLRDHLPEILCTTACDRLTDRLPTAYRRWLIAKSLAARIVYREGIEAVEAVEAESIGPLAAEFLQREIERERLAGEVDGSRMADAAEIANLLRTTSILSTIQSTEADGP